MDQPTRIVRVHRPSQWRSQSTQATQPARTWPDSPFEREVSVAPSRLISLTAAIGVFAVVGFVGMYIVAWAFSYTSEYTSHGVHHIPQHALHWALLAALFSGLLVSPLRAVRSISALVGRALQSILPRGLFVGLIMPWPAMLIGGIFTLALAFMFGVVVTPLELLYNLILAVVGLVRRPGLRAPWR